MKCKRIAAILLTCITVNLSAPYAWANETNTVISVGDEEKLVTPGTIAGYTIGNEKTVNDMIQQYKFNKGKTGHAFAAERANNLISRIHGEKAVVVGDNNVKNGADRLIFRGDGTKIFIQDKYYRDVAQGINACFDEYGIFRYITSDGTPMMIEVPSDQYDEAVKLMAKKIKNGVVPGITDEADAKNIIKKGHLTYQQAVNLAKPGTIESLAYDAANGVVTASYTLGISTVLNFAAMKINGYDTKTSLKLSSIEGIKMGGAVFGTEIIIGQLTKAGVTDLFVPQMESLVNTFGDDFANALLYAGKTAGIHIGKNATHEAAKILSNEVVTSGVFIVVLSLDDVYNLFTGHISGKQLIKNFAVTGAGVVGGAVGSVVGGAAGGAVGTAIAPGAGTTVGAGVGKVGGAEAVGGAASFVTDQVLSLFIKDDADEMAEIIAENFQIIATEYLLNEEEAEKVTIELSKALDSKTLRKMFASEDRGEFAIELLIPMVEQVVSVREKIVMPDSSEYRSQILAELDGVVFIH